MAPGFAADRGSSSLTPWPTIHWTSCRGESSEAGCSADRLPVAEDGDAVGHPGNLFQAVRNVDNAHALRAETTERGKQDFRFHNGQRRRWLIEHENPRATGKRPGNLHELPLGRRQLGDRALHVRQLGSAPARLRGLGHRRSSAGDPTISNGAARAPCKCSRRSTGWEPATIPDG